METQKKPPQEPIRFFRNFHQVSQEKSILSRVKRESQVQRFQFKPQIDSPHC